MGHVAPKHENWDANLWPVVLSLPLLRVDRGHSSTQVNFVSVHGLESEASNSPLFESGKASDLEFAPLFVYLMSKRTGEHILSCIFLPDTDGAEAMVSVPTYNIEDSGPSLLHGSRPGALRRREVVSRCLTLGIALA